MRYCLKICRARCPHRAAEKRKSIHRKPVNDLQRTMPASFRILSCNHGILSSTSYLPAARFCFPQEAPLFVENRSDSFQAIPHNSKCRYGERGAADAKPKAQIILDAAKVSAASGGNSEPKQGQRSQSARGFCPRSTMRVPQPDIIEHFGNADAVPQPPKRCLSRKAGIVRCCPWNLQRIPAALCLTSCLCLRNVRHFPCFQIRLENQRTMNKEGIL